ncbi:CoA-binding protein [Polycladidibacter hongkongensis]|uniref:CoA-binding protein n=1 Tax=Polycladidibacter hongkongensis TaxID=1647556 RepID=UPI00082B53FB|nr:CoA-binding protein [Pseudovibrio hongkongensis]
MSTQPYPQGYTQEVLAKVNTIALVGASNKPERPSYKVMRFLQDNGYKVFPVNPGLAGGELLGEPVYASLADVPSKIDMIDIFRNSEAAAAIIDEALTLENTPSTIWMQLGVINQNAAAKATEQGLEVIMDRCPKIELGG